MITYYFIFIIYFDLTSLKNIKNGVYNFITNNSYLYNHEQNISISKNFSYPKTFFRIIKEKRNEDFFYRIEEILSNKKLNPTPRNELILNTDTNNTSLWKFNEIKEKKYVIQNFNKCFIVLSHNKLFCFFISIDNATNFQFNKIFSELNKKDSKILRDEPIDVLIKYIDLRDPNLVREGIHQIEKDYDNEELRYSIRSILMNIPWVRKIFILMPNKKVRYFNESNKLFHNKIIYIKDKDLLGYDSSNCNAFLFRYWQMKKFGISENIIVMDDDLFIAKKLNKKDFFYIKNGKVVPLIVTSNFLEINKENVKKNIEIYETKAKNTKEEQNEDIFLYVKYLTYNFLFESLNITQNKSLFIPFYTHNAIPINLKDAEEIFYLIYNSKYKYGTLDCPYRYYEFIHFQIFITSYTFIKYNKKVNNIPYRYIRLNNSINSNYDVSLFCINKGAGNYPKLNLEKAKIVMEYFFYIPSPFEINRKSFYHLSFDVIHSMDKNEKLYLNRISHMVEKVDVIYIITYLLLLNGLIIIKKIKNLSDKYLDNGQSLIFI